MRIVLAALMAMGLMASQAVAADIFSTKSGSRLFKSQTRVLDDRASQKYKASVGLQPKGFYTPTK